MSIKILMPSLSPTMTEGILHKWFVKVGDEVNIEVDILARYVDRQLKNMR